MMATISRRAPAFATTFVILISATGASAEDARPHLSADLSPLAMFMQADIVVKVVMLGLLAASVLTWTIFLAKTVELRRATGDVRGTIAKMSLVPWLRPASERLEPSDGVGRAFMEAALAELKLSELMSDKAGVKERVRSRLARLELAAGRKLTMGVGALASIGSTAPFIGLFGTVWGIMNAFVGIAKAQTTNLAVVAPGIAEALMATAMGLLAAIPAVLVYNRFSRSLSHYRALVGDLGEEVMRMTSRELDHREARPSSVKERLHGG